MIDPFIGYEKGLFCRLFYQTRTYSSGVEKSA
jgi:hypothetical protein